MFAVVVYLLWAYYLWRSPLPPWARSAGSIVLTLWALGIMWSRPALGAHYPSDVLGGVLLGVTFVAAGLAVMPVVLRSPVRRRIITRGSRSAP
jgi:membrane-associated phospholipid phosphatase